MDARALGDRARGRAARALRSVRGAARDASDCRRRTHGRARAGGRGARSRRVLHAPAVRRRRQRARLSGCAL